MDVEQLHGFQLEIVNSSRFCNKVFLKEKKNRADLTEQGVHFVLWVFWFVLLYMSAGEWKYKVNWHLRGLRLMATRVCILSEREMVEWSIIIWIWVKLRETDWSTLCTYGSGIRWIYDFINSLTERDVMWAVGESIVWRVN